MNSYWYIDFKKLNEFVENNEILDTKSNFYNKRQHRIIDDIILKYRNEHMRLTKKQQKEKEIWDREYAEGRHSLTYEQALKEDMRKKRTADKAKLTIAKKAARETMTEYAKMQAEILCLKAEIEHLRSLKDLNSDIPQEEKPIEYEQLDKRFPDGVGEDDIQKLSEECKRRLNEEAEEDLKNIGIVEDPNAELGKLERLMTNEDLDLPLGPDPDDERRERFLALCYANVSKKYTEGVIPATIANVFVSRFRYGDPFKANGWAPQIEGHTGILLKKMQEYCDYVEKEIGKAD